MGRKTLVRKDDKGLYVRVDGYISRPGEVVGMSHAFDMTDGDLKEGEYVHAHHVSQCPYSRLRTDSGKVLIWTHEGAFNHYV